MIIFDLLMTVFEDFLITYFLLTFFMVDKKFKWSIILTPIFVLETFILNNYFMNNELLFFVLMITWASVLCLLKKKVNVFFLVLPGLLIGLLLISNISSFYLVSFLFSVKMNNISDNINLLFTAVLLSRVIFLTASIWLYSKLNFLKDQRRAYEVFEYKSFIVLMLCLFSIVTTIGESIVYGIFDYKIYLLLTVEFVLMCISSIMLFIKIQHDYKSKLEMKSEIIQLEYSRKMYFETCKLSYQFSKDKHSLYYMLKQIETVALERKDKTLIDLVGNTINQISNVDISYTSSNPVFDYMITQKIKNLKLYNYDVVYTANITENKFFSDSLLVENLEKYINLLTFDKSKDQNKCLEINVYEKTGYIIFELKINRQVELSNSVFDFQNKSRNITQENLYCNIGESIIKILIQ